MVQLRSGLRAGNRRGPGIVPDGTRVIHGHFLADAFDRVVAGAQAHALGCGTPSRGWSPITSTSSGRHGHARRMLPAAARARARASRIRGPGLDAEHGHALHGRQGPWMISSSSGSQTASRRASGYFCRHLRVPYAPPAFRARTSTPAARRSSTTSRAPPDRAFILERNMADLACYEEAARRIAGVLTGHVREDGLRPVTPPSRRPGLGSRSPCSSRRTPGGWGRPGRRRARDRP